MMSFRARFAMASTALCILSNLLCAAPALTTIQDVLYKADGTRFNGILQIRWNSFQAADATNIPAQTVTTQVLNGYLHVLLVPTTNANPAAVYTVVYNSDGNIQFTETWVVPPSSGPLRVADVRSSAFVGSAGGAALGTMQIGDISGLRTELNIRPTMGAGFATSRAAIIDSTGGISSALGNLSDCVHIDGSSGPCGGSGGGGSVAGPTTSGFVDAESPSGIVDGANTAFQLSNAPNPAGSLTLFRNGLAMQRNTEFTVSGSTIAFQPGSIPQAGDVLQAFYRIVAAAPSAAGCTLFTLNASGTAWTASTTQDIPLFALPAKTIITGIREKTATAWSGSGFTTLSLSVGDSVGGAAVYTAAAYDLTAPASNTNFRNTQLFKSSTDAGSTVIAHITANAALNAAPITGTINIDVCSVVLP